MVISKIFNQYGEEVVAEEYYLEGHGWYHRKLSCFSSQDMGLGTCICVAHSTYSETPVARETVRKAIASLASTEVSEEEAEDLASPSLKSLILDKFLLLGFSWHEMEIFCQICYKLRLNPLPSLRSLLKGVCWVDFSHAQPGTGWDGNEPELICWFYPESGIVILEAYVPSGD